MTAPTTATKEEEEEEEEEINTDNENEEKKKRRMRKKTRRGIEVAKMCSTLVTQKHTQSYTYPNPISSIHHTHTHCRRETIDPDCHRLRIL